MAKTRRRGRKSGKRRHGSRRRMRGGTNTTQQYQIAYGGLCNTTSQLDKVKTKLDLALRHITDAHSEMVDEPGVGRFKPQTRKQNPIDMAVFGPIIGGIRNTLDSVDQVKQDMQSARSGIVHISKDANKHWKPPAGTVGEPGGCWRR